MFRLIFIGFQQRKYCSRDIILWQKGSKTWSFFALDQKTPLNFSPKRKKCPFTSVERRFNLVFTLDFPEKKNK